MDSLPFSKEDRVVIPDFSESLFAAKVWLWFSVGVLCAWRIAIANHIGEVIFFQVLIGIVFVYGVELQHQSLHSLGLKNRRINYFFGVALGLPMLVAFSAYQDNHLRHHKNLGTDKDTEFFNYGKQRSLSVADLLTMVFMVNHFKHLMVCWGRLALGKSIMCTTSRRTRLLRREYWLFLALIVLAIGGSLYYKSDYLVYAWLIPLLLIAAPVHAMVELPEHFGCRRDSRNFFHNTRTIKSNDFMYFFTNGNNFHVEHHLYPRWPMEKLHLLHEMHKKSIEFYNETYRDFYWAFIMHFLGRRQIDDAIDAAARND